MQIPLTTNDIFVNSSDHTNKPHWIETIEEAPGLMHFSPSASALLKPLFQLGLKNGIATYFYTQPDRALTDHGQQGLADFIKKSFLMPCWVANFGGSLEQLYINDTSILEITKSRDLLNLRLATQSVSIANDYKIFIDKFTNDPPAENPCLIYMLTQDKGEYELQTVGDPSVPFIAHQYTTSIQEDFCWLEEAMKDPERSGRLVLIDGPPGTGKTYLIRSLIGSLGALEPDTKFIFIPSSMVESIAGPEFLSVLLSNNSGPIYIIIEDADECLLVRQDQHSNHSGLSTILNMTDGILGAMLDIRVLATTNQKADNLDPAILRSGRLARHIHIGPLNAQEATRALHHYRPDLKDKSFSQPTELANVFQVIKNEPKRS